MRSAFSCAGCHLIKGRKWFDLKLQEEACELEQLKVQCLARGWAEVSASCSVARPAHLGGLGSTLGGNPLKTSLEPKGIY